MDRGTDVVAGPPDDLVRRYFPRPRVEPDEPSLEQLYKVGGWFFPTADWWVLMMWVMPPFLAITLSVVLRLSARVRSAAAAQQASGLVSLPLIILSYAQSSGAISSAARSGLLVGWIAWLAAALGLMRGAQAGARPRLLGVDTK